MKTAIELLSLLLVGWIAGAELGSWCCVQPVVARLPYEHFVAAEQGMLRTFGRIMPVLMPLSGILAVALIILTRADTRVVLWFRVAAAMCIARHRCHHAVGKCADQHPDGHLAADQRSCRMAADARTMALLPRRARYPIRRSLLCSWRFRSC